MTLEEEVEDIIERLDNLIKENFDLMSFDGYNNLILKVRDARDLLMNGLKENE